MVNYKNNPAFFKILPDLLRIPDIIRNFADDMKQIEVVAAIICKGEYIFATQRGYGDFKDGWEFPGGKMEPGESPEEALISQPCCCSA